MKKPICILLLALALVSCKEGEIEIKDKTETFQIKSISVKDEYKIFVYLPPNYDVNSNRNHLVLGLDGDFRFEEIASIVSEKSQNGTIPPCIFVAIGNSENRNRDYTPTIFKHGKGGAQHFYQFIIDELIPELESRYKIGAESKKTLMGNSFGGLFTQFAMFQDRSTNPFDNFISVGCSYWYDSGVIFEYEQKYADTYTALPVKFFNAMGTLEGGVSIASFEEMNERLRSRSFTGFKSETTYIKEHGHSGSANIGFKKGLDYVFRN